MLDCLLTIAFVCFSEPSKAEVDPRDGLMRFATVGTGKAEVSVTIYTDSLAILDWWRMPRACEGNVCVAYHKSCKTEPAGTICAYTLAGRPFTTASLSIRATDRAALAEAESSIALVGEVGARWQIPLSLLSVESRDEWPPFCRNEGRQPICFDGIVARLDRLGAFEIDGDERELLPIVAVAGEQGWRVETVGAPTSPPLGSGWTVYAPLSKLTTLRFSPPAQRKPGDLRAFLIAIEPLVGLGMSVKAMDSDGREIEP
jgi:hypothetical protein